MNRTTNEIIGVDIGEMLINTYLLNSDGLDSCNEYSLEGPLTPGAFTILICERIELLYKDCSSNLLVIAIPGIITNSGRTVESCQDWPGWTQVPLADWIEIRLGKKVIIFRKDSASVFAESSEFFKAFKNKILNHL